MTFGECKMIALQKMSALSVSYLTESRDTRPYLDIMTAPANEGILMIAAEMCIRDRPVGALWQGAF